MNKVSTHSPDVVKEQWIMCAYQHGRIDDCEAAMSFETEQDATKAAVEWAEEITHDGNTEHEAVVLRVVSVFRGGKDCR